MIGIKIKIIIVTTVIMDIIVHIFIPLFLPLISIAALCNILPPSTGPNGNKLANPIPKLSVAIHSSKFAITNNI